MTGKEFQKPFDFEDILEIAEAMSARSLKEAGPVKASLTEQMEHLGIPGDIFPAEITEKLPLVTTAMMIQKVEFPETPISLTSSLDSIIGDTGYEVLATKFREDMGEDVTGSEIRDLLMGTLDALYHTSATDDEKAAQSFSNKFQAAKEVAATNGSSVAEVYRNDDLYLEIFRTAYTPVGFAAEKLHEVAAINTDALMGNVMKISKLMFGTEEDIDPEMFAELMENEFVRQQVEAMGDTLRDNAKQTIRSDIIRYWGLDTLCNLPAEVQDHLGVADFLSDFGAVAFVALSSQLNRNLRRFVACQRRFYGPVL